MRVLLVLLLAFATLVAGGSLAHGKESAPPKPPPGPPVEFSGHPGSTAPPEIEAFAWVVADAASGEVLAAKGPHHRLPQASTTKALTALTVLPHLNTNATYVATMQDEKAEGSQVGIKAGSTYTIHQLLLGLMLPSGNDAASALANANGGWPKTVAEMNGEAARVGARDTAVKNPSGLDANGHHSTAFDLVTIFREGLKLPLFRELIGTKKAAFPGEMPKPGKKREAYEIANQDRLLQQGYPGIIGGKTGYTTNAGRTFVGAASRNGHTLLIAIMRTEQHLDEAAAKLLNWGFANVGKVNPVATLPVAGEATSEPAPAPNPAATPAPVPAVNPTPAAAPDAAAAPVAASVSNQPGSSSTDLPWLLIALTVFLGVLIVASVWRARSLIKQGK